MSQDAIIDAALDVFGRRGVRRGTLGEIARRAGVSRATLYRRYAGKDALVAATVMHEARRLFALVDEALVPEDEPAVLLERGLLTALAHLRRHPVLQRVLRDEPGAILPVLTVQAAPLLEAAVDFATPYIERAVKQERIVPLVSPRAAAEWAARILLSLVLTPSVTVDLDDETELKAFVSWILPKGGHP
jgi:AcrR family transcriptional regulator